MLTPSETPSNLHTRKQAAQEIDRAMARFGLIVKILSELEHTELPYAGDSDIRHGCERALTAILVELARIQPATSDQDEQESAPPLSRLYSKPACDLIDGDQLQRMEQFIQRILGNQNRHS